MLHVYICLFPPGKSAYVDMLARYFSMRLAAHSCTRHGFLQKHAHWCMANDIYGRVDH